MYVDGRTFSKYAHYSLVDGIGYAERAHGCMVNMQLFCQTKIVIAMVTAIIID